MENTYEKRLPLFCELVPDWENQTIVSQNGRLTKAYGNDALKIWIEKALMPDVERLSYEAHSTSYGHDIRQFMGRPLTDTTIKLMIAAVQETLYVNPYILKADCIESTKQGSCLSLTFEIQTVYDSFTLQKEYTL